MFQTKFASLAVVVSAFSVLCLALPVSAQTIEPPAVEWWRIYGGDVNELGNKIHRGGSSVQQISDGGYIVTGSINPYSGMETWTGDISLIKTDSLGNLAWEKKYGNENLDESGRFVLQAQDGGYIIAGFSLHYYRLYIIKVDSSGNIIWDKLLNQFSDICNSIPYSFRQTGDDGYIFSGTSSSNNCIIYLLKTDSLFNTSWKKTFSGISNAESGSVDQTQDAGYVVLGTKYLLGEEKGSVLWLIKTDSLGNSIWEKTYGDEYYFNRGYCVRQTKDSGYIISGGRYLRGKPYGHNLFLIKTDIEGNLLWETTFGENFSGRSTVLQTRDGGYIVTGGKASILYLARINPFGNIMWEVEFYGIEVHSNDEIQQTQDGGYIVTGKHYNNNQSYISLLKIAPELPKSPQNPLAQFRTPQSIGISWIDNSQNETNFVLERRVQAFDNFQEIAQIPANTTQYIDGVVPSDSEVTYRISAVNSNGSSPKVTSDTLTTPKGRNQLKLFKPDANGGQWVDLIHPSQFNSSLGTAVIVHGWQIAEWLDPVNGWMFEMAQAIDSRLNHQVNVLAWDWVEEATAPLPGKPAGHVDEQGKKLAENLFPLISQNPEKPVHLMGHSLGTHLIIVAAGHFGNKGNLPEQLTLWDTPDTKSEGLGYIDDNIKLLRLGGVYVDTYSSCTGLGTHNSNIWVKVPCPERVICQAELVSLFICHPESHNWYHRTISKSYIQSVHLDEDCTSLKFSKGLGFGNSILLSKDERLRIPASGCENTGTLMFSKLCHCQILFFCPDEIYGLTEKRDCATSQSPVKQTTRPDRISVKTQRTGQGGGAQAEELLGEYQEDIFIDPSWDYMSLEYDFLSAPAPASLEIALVQGETAYPIFSINSESVFNEAFLDTGLRSVSRFQEKIVTLVIELRSSQPGAEALVRNITFWQDPYHENTPPQAIAGEDQAFTVHCGETVDVSLDGSESYDPDENDTMVARWETTDGLLTLGLQSVIKLSPGQYNITLVVEDSAGSVSGDEVKITVISEPCPFRRGDSNGDETIDISDAINTLGFLFTGAGYALCKDASDANDDGAIDISDAITTLGFLFLGTKIIPPPFLERGFDPSEDSLNCDYYMSF